MTPEQQEILADLLRHTGCEVSSATRAKVLSFLPRQELFVRSRLLGEWIVDPATGIRTQRPSDERIVWRFEPTDDLFGAAEFPAHSAGSKHYDKPKTKDWTQKKAAALLGVSERQLRKYKTNPPDEYWPGWTDPVALKQWKNQREDRDLMAQAMTRHLPYREGATEKARKRGT